MQNLGPRLLSESFKDEGSTEHLGNIYETIFPIRVKHVLEMVAIDDALSIAYTHYVG